MLLIDQSVLDQMERQYPGIEASVRYREEEDLPGCRHCGATDTARVGAGLVGRTINIAVATSKFRLVANGPIPGKYFCNCCRTFFD